MSDPVPSVDPDGLAAATIAFGEQLQMQAEQQRSYLHRFKDGRISLELEWVDPQQWVNAAILAYLAHTQLK